MIRLRRGVLVVRLRVTHFGKHHERGNDQNREFHHASWIHLLPMLDQPVKYFAKVND